MDKILLFIPCYNCHDEILKVLDSLQAYKKYFTEIIVVDNGSKDSTRENAVNWAKEHLDMPVSVLFNKNNYNLGGSHKVAFNYAIDKDFDYIIVFHGDNQGEISDIKEHLVEYAYNFAKENNNCTILLKGPTTIITNGIEIYLVNKGTVGMSTAGSGDVLSGILAGILAYNKDNILLGATAGAYVNGLAAEIGVEELNEISLMARDTIINIPRAIKVIKEC